MCFQFYTLVVLKYYIGAELRHSVSQLFFSTNIHLEVFFFSSQELLTWKLVIFLYCTSLLKQKVKGYLNTSTVYVCVCIYIYIYRLYIGKGKYSYKKNPMGLDYLFLHFLWLMMHKSIAENWWQNRVILNSYPKQTNANRPCWPNTVPR